MLMALTVQSSLSESVPIWTSCRPKFGTERMCNCAGKQLRVHVLQLDLGDLASVKVFAEKTQALLDGRKLDVLVRCLTVKL